MNATSMRQLLSLQCEYPDLIPDYWDTVEPIDTPFHKDDLEDIVSEFSAHSQCDSRALVFLNRFAWPGFDQSIDLRNKPIQWTTAHNIIEITFNHEWVDGAQVLAHFISRAAVFLSPDYASVPQWKADVARYAEFRVSYTPQEFQKIIATRATHAPFGPFGCLGDIQWFNYFGEVHIDLIGKNRLLNAGWAHVDESDGGIACYATEKLDDPNARARRKEIAKSLDEFVWSPGCKAEDKRIPTFG